MSEDKMFDDIVERELFIELVAAGIPELNAGIEVGWTPARIRKNLADPDFAEIVSTAKERADGNIEQALYSLAAKGNLGAIQMWLYNRRPHQWKDVKRIEVKTDTTINIGVVASVKQGALELLREHGVEAMQALAIEASSSE